MMAEKHEQWMPLYIADYLGDTMHLTAEQHGAYLLLLMAAWKRGGHVPDDDEQLAIITRMGARWQTHAAAIVRAFFTQRDGMLWSTRIEAELVKAKAKTAQKSAAGRAGASAKWQNDGKRMADASQEQRQTDAPSPSPICSDTIVSDGKPSKVTDPNEIIFGYGVPLLTNAGTAEKQARSFLGGLRKQHGDAALIDKLRECMKAKPLQPLEWLAAALPPGGARKRLPEAENFAEKTYEGGLL